MVKERDQRELVQRCITGAPGAWRELVDRYASVVQAVARRYLKLLGVEETADVEDVVQEVFTALTNQDYRLMRNYDSSYSFTTWLGVLARTHAHRLVRRRRPQTASVEDLSRHPDPGVDLDGQLQRGEEQELLERALNEMQWRDAQILRLRFLRELDYRGIANALRIPEGSVGQTLFRAKQRLLERLKKVFGSLVLM
ncbi:MAG: RNA polymerase sigma factor, partial [Planctomycetota bacterium]